MDGMQTQCIEAIHRDLLVSEIEFLGAASADAGALGNATSVPKAQ
jgi:hypothetical protein